MGGKGEGKGKAKVKREKAVGMSDRAQGLFFHDYLTTTGDISHSIRPTIPSYTLSTDVPTLYFPGSQLR